MASLPVVSYAGDRSIFARLESGIVSSLPTAAVEWKRSYGRTSKSVYVEVQFQNFDVDLLLKGRKNLIGQHVLHTFWTDCSDVDVYKNSLKDDILSWLGTLKKTGSSSDWLLVLVENNSSRANKLLARTTVLDRIKQDIGGKTPERCISIMDPTKSDSKAAESMQTFLHKFRQFFLQSYNRTLNRFEELIRSEREKRNEPGWNFCTYFLLQEQLAFAYEIMGLHEALVQYDELDALFTQFILNSSVGVSPGWLEAFNTQLSDWTGFSLDKNINSRLRTNIEKCSLSLLDLRNYLFSRQGSLLLAMSRGDQVARRCLTFLHNTLQELTIMEVECVQGSKEIWVCLCAFEVLNNTKGNSLHSAALWSFLREKLLVLGGLCGLTPGKTPPTSSQLHLVVSLFGGLMDDKYLKLDNNQKNPAERLKESLSSAPSFQKNYLDIAETAISNYKHIGRIRCARLIGMELAQFYLEADQVHQAIAFLADSLKTFQFEGWEKLSMKTLLDLAKCYKLSQEDEKYLRTCVQIASCPGASSEDRDLYFREILSKLEALSAAGNIIASADDTVKMVSATQVKDSPEDKTVPGCQIKYHLEVLSNLPVTIECERVEVSLVHSVPPETVDGSAASRPAVGQPEVAVRKASMLTMAGGEDRRGGGMAAGGQRRTGVNRSPSVASSTASVFSMMDNGDIEEESGDNTGPADAPDRLHMRERLEYKQDKSLYAARLVCKNATKVLKRKDSSGTILKDGQLKPADYTNSLSANNVTLYPGFNKIEVIGEAGIQGVYTLTQMRICWRQLHLLENLSMQGAASFQVASEQPVILLNKGEGELFAGRPNKLSLSIYCGSESLPEGQQIQVTCGRGLVARTAGANHEYNPTVVVTFPGGQPFETVSQDIWVLCKLENKKDANSVEFTVRIQDPWRQTTMDICLNFLPILYTTFNLLTAMDKKFVQVKVICMSNETSYKLTGVNMELVNKENLPGLELRSMNQNYPELVISKQFEGAFLWQLKMADNNQLTSHQDGTADQNNKSPLNKVGGDEPAKVALKFSYAPIASEEGDKTSSAALGSAGKRNEDDIVTSLQSMDLAGDLDELMETEKEFCASYTFQDYRTLYTVYAKVEPAKGNEFCRASTLCPMKIEVEQLFNPQTADNKQQGQQRRGDTAASSGGGQTSLFYEIIADQTQWAVCGKQGAVINIQRSARESITVDVMPLTGGQLPLPTVRLSKYIPADHGGNNAARLDPFAIGQVYNMSRAQQIHVLPPVTAASTAAAAAASHQQMLVAAGGAATQQQEFLSLP